MLHQEEESNEYTLTKITEMEEENKKRKAEIQSLRQEKKNKKRDNELILRDKDTLEKEVRSKQEETEDLENVYKELLLLSNELKVIKKNEVPAMDNDEEWQQSPTNARSESAAMSAMSAELEMMMMDAPEDGEDE